jgi:hypothetical protein
MGFGQSKPQNKICPTYKPQNKICPTCKSQNKICPTCKPATYYWDTRPPNRKEFGTDIEALWQIGAAETGDTTSRNYKSYQEGPNGVCVYRPANPRSKESAKYEMTCSKVPCGNGYDAVNWNGQIVCLRTGFSDSVN